MNVSILDTNTKCCHLIANMDTGYKYQMLYSGNGILLKVAKIMTETFTVYQINECFGSWNINVALGGN